MKSNGYVVIDHQHNAIWGVGSTADEAWRDFVCGLEEAGVTVVDGDAIYPEQIESSKYLINSASEALIERVRHNGGNLAWGRVNGVLCTVEEEDAAE